MFGKQSIIFLLVLSVVSSTFYLPVFAPRTQAQLAAVTWDVPTIVMKVVDGAAMVIAQTMIDRMAQSTIKWAQEGFEGNPAYAINPKQFFTDIADGVAGNFIAGSDLNFLCSPFQTQIRLALQKHYVPTNQFQCTLTEVVGNIDAFYSDFSQGGWDGWFAMTQNSSNNPYGAYLDAQVELDSRIASAVGIQSQQLDWNQGFLSHEKCDGVELDDQINPGKKICVGNTVTVTPGTVIQSQLNEVLGTGLKKLEVAQHIDQLISSFATGLLNRYVFGPKGLFADGSSDTGTTNVSSRTGNLDIDGDGIPDGMDFDFDGRLESSTDVCHHGGIPTVPPGCLGSLTADTSPYFTPVCQALDRAVVVLTDFTSFIDTYADQMEGGAGLSGTIIPPILAAPPGTVFPTPNSGGVDNFANKADAQIWWDRHNQVDSAISEIISAIRERSAFYFDDLEIATNRYYHFITKVSESLIKDADLDLARNGNGGGGLENLMKHSAYNLRYFMEVKAEIGKCESPDFGTVGGIPLPPEVEPPPPPGGGGGGGGGGVCQAVTQQGVLGILQSFAPTNTGINQALPSLRSAYGSQVTIYGSPGDPAIDKINFGGGMTVDVISDAGGVNAAWVWQVITPCSGGGGGGGGGAQPPSLVGDLEAEIAKYSLPTSPEEQGQILNAVAWNNRGSGWVLLGKAAGSNCPAPSGDLISCDYLVHQPTMYGYDVFGSEGSPNMTATWQGPDTSIAGRVADGSRSIVAPTQP